MKVMKYFMLAALLFVSLAGEAFAFGEIFRLETSGVENCGDYDMAKFGAGNNDDMWVHIISEDQIIISFTPNFQPGTAFPMNIVSYLIDGKKVAMTGTAYESDDLFLTIQGTIYLNKDGSVKNLKGTFIHNGLVDAGCFASGKFWTMERIQ